MLPQVAAKKRSSKRSGAEKEKKNKKYLQTLGLIIIMSQRRRRRRKSPRRTKTNSRGVINHHPLSPIHISLDIQRAFQIFNIYLCSSLYFGGEEKQIELFITPPRIDEMNVYGKCFIAFFKLWFWERVINFWCRRFFHFLFFCTAAYSLPAPPPSMDTALRYMIRGSACWLFYICWHGMNTLITFFDPRHTHHRHTGYNNGHW